MNRERWMEIARGDDLRFFWRIFRRREQSRALRGFWSLWMCLSARRHGGYIGPGAVIEGIPSMPHGLHGVYISRFARIGASCRIYQNVTVGEADGKAPVIGSGCLLGAGAVLIGPIRVGDGAKIGAGAVVVRDVPAGCTVVAQPSRILPPGHHG